MIREEFLELLATFIQEELRTNFEARKANEPYRAAGDALVDDALELIP